MTHDVIDGNLVPRLAADGFGAVPQAVEIPAPIDVQGVQKFPGFVREADAAAVLAPIAAALRDEHEPCILRLLGFRALLNCSLESGDGFGPERATAVDAGLRPGEVD